MTKIAEKPEDEDIQKYSGDFKEIVLHHLERGLPPEELKRLRDYAGKVEAEDYFLEDEPFIQNITHEQILSECAMEPWCTLEENYGHWRGRFIEIGTVNSSPVYYIGGMGLYICQPVQEIRAMLEIMLTWPAPPPGYND